MVWNASQSRFEKAKCKPSIVITKKARKHGLSILQQQRSSHSRLADTIEVSFHQHRRFNYQIKSFGHADNLKRKVKIGLCCKRLDEIREILKSKTQWNLISPYTRIRYSLHELDRVVVNARNLIGFAFGDEAARFACN